MNDLHVVGTSKAQSLVYSDEKNSSIKAAGKISPHAKANRIVRIRQTPLKFENQGGGFYDPNLT